MKKSLYQIEQEYLTIAGQLETGEYTPDLEKALQINQDELQHKAISYGYVIKSYQDDISAIDQEMKRLKALKDSKVNTVERIKNTIKDAMLNYGIDKVESPTLKLSFRTTKSVEIVDHNIIDKQYIKEKVTYTPDKKAIKEAIENNKMVNGAILVTNDNLQIK